jgi:hypothetical protein
MRGEPFISGVLRELGGLKKNFPGQQFLELEQMRGVSGHGGKILAATARIRQRGLLVKRFIPPNNSLR